MNKVVLLILGCLAFISSQLVDDDSSDVFVILAPKIIRPGLPVSISLNIQGRFLEAVVTVKLIDNRNVVKFTATTSPIRGTLSLSGRSSHQVMKLIPPTDLAAGSYTLKAELSLDKVNRTTELEDEAGVTVVSKTTSIFIQLDKAVYKPSQLVQFRVIVTKPDLTPYVGTVDMEIFDANRNKIKQWKDVSLTMGLASESLSLSDQPVLGTWKIRVAAESGEIQEKEFDVDEYVLPKFEVTGKLPSFILIESPSIRVTVGAEYTFGKGVDGKADIRLKNGNRFTTGYWNSRTRMLDPLPVIEQTNIMLVDGKTDLTFTKRQLLSLYQRNQVYDGIELQLEVNVTETLTGIKRAAEVQTTKFYNRAEELEILNSSPTNFKPGFQYSGFVKLSAQDGSVIVNPRRAVVRTTIQEKIVVTTTTTSEAPSGALSSSRRIAGPIFFPQRTTSRKLPEVFIDFPENGVQKFDVQIPVTAVDSVSFEIEYDPPTTTEEDGEEEVSISQVRVRAFRSATETESPTDSFLQVTLTSENLKAGDVARFDLDLSNSNRLVYYLVVSRGSVIRASSVWASSFFHRIQFTTTTEMAPSSKILVYYVNPSNNETVVDSITFNVEGAFENEVSIEFSEDEAEPGDTVSLQVSASPNSLIGLLAVDQSVLLLGTGNDITQGDVVKELEDYNSMSPSSSFDDVCCFRFFFWPRPIGGDSASEIISNSGLVVLTNALVPEKERVYYDYGPVFFARSARGGDGAEGSSGPSAPQNSNEPVAVRKIFPETWIWLNESSTGGSLTTQHIVPDTITSWVATAFALHDEDGLGVSPTSSKITVFKPFFVSLNLPFSVVRGEEVILQVIVFNYLGQEVNVVVELPASDEYDNIRINRRGQAFYTSSTQRASIRAKADAGTTVSFPIVPRVLGQMRVRVTARASSAADAVERELLVEPEGVEKSYTKNILIDRTGDNSPNGANANGLEETVELIVPPTAVSGSKRIDFSLIGNIIGPALNGLDKLIKMPYGCGEQNMLNFAPTVFVTEYLSLAGILTDEQKTKSVGFMEKGYQRELTYQRTDGSFSAFGNNDPSGSMWLTAFVVKSFQRADKFIFVDADLVKKATQWMISVQNEDGSFPEPGRVIHKSMMGGGADDSTRKYTLTAYVLTALTELVSEGKSPSNEVEIRAAMRKAIRFLNDYVTRNGNYRDRQYLLALLAYALEIADSNKADLVLNKLNEYAITEGGFKFWEISQDRPASNSLVWHPPYEQSNAIEIELAAYALLTYASRGGSVVDGLPILRWMTTQRSENGGFSSTQDTVVGLQALSAFALFVGGDSLDMTITTTADHPAPDGTTDTYSVSKDNELILQMKNLPAQTTSVDLFATGSGMALATFTVSYNEEDHDQEVAFNTTAVILSEDKNQYTVKVCTRWVLADTTGMAVMEIGVLTGFSADVDKLREEKVKGIKKIETTNRKVVIYWEELGRTETCIEVDAQRTGLVAKSQPAAIRVYDYYEPDKQQTIFYSSSLIKDVNVCEVCGEGCKGCERYDEAK